MFCDSAGRSRSGLLVKPPQKASYSETQDNDSLTETPTSEPDSDYHSSRDFDADIELTLEDLRPPFRPNKPGVVQKDASAFISEGNSCKSSDESLRDRRNVRHSTQRDAKRTHLSSPYSSEESRRERQRSRHIEKECEHERKGRCDSQRSHRALSPTLPNEDSDDSYREKTGGCSRSEKPSPRRSQQTASRNGHDEQYDHPNDFDGSSRSVAHGSHTPSRHQSHGQHRSHSPRSKGRGREESRRSSLSHHSIDAKHSNSNQYQARYRSVSPIRTTNEGQRYNQDHHRSTSPRSVHSKMSTEKGSSNESRPRISLIPPQRKVDSPPEKGKGSHITEHSHRDGSRLLPESLGVGRVNHGEVSRSKSKSPISHGSRQGRSQSPTFNTHPNDGRRRRDVSRSDNDELNAELLHESIGSLSISDLENVASPSYSRSVSNMLDDVLERSKSGDLRRAFSMNDLAFGPCHAKSILRAGRYSPNAVGRENNYDSSGNSVTFSEASLIIAENDLGCTKVVKKDRFRSMSAAPKQLNPNEVLDAVHAGADHESSRDMLKRLLRSRDCLEEPVDGKEPAFEDIWNDDDSSLPVLLARQRQAARARGNAIPSTAGRKSPTDQQPENTDSQGGFERSARLHPQQSRPAPMRSPTPPRQLSSNSVGATTRVQDGRCNNGSNPGRPPTNRVSPPWGPSFSSQQGAKQTAASNTIHQIATLGGSLRNLLGQPSHDSQHSKHARRSRPDERKDIAAFVNQMSSADPRLANRAPRTGLPRTPATARPNGTMSQQPAATGLGGSLRNIFGGPPKPVVNGNQNTNIPPSAAALIRMASDSRMVQAPSPRSPPSASASASISSISKSRAPQAMLSSSAFVSSATRRPGLFKSQSARLTFMGVVRQPPPQAVLGFWDPGSEELQALDEPLSDNQSMMLFATDPRMEMRPPRLPPSAPPEGASVMSSMSRASRPGLFKSQSVRSNQVQQQQQQLPPPRNAFGHIDRSMSNSSRPMLMTMQQSHSLSPHESSPPQQVSNRKHMSASEKRLYIAHSAFASNASAMAQAKPYPSHSGYGSVTVTKDSRAAMVGHSGASYMPPPVVNCVSAPNA